MNIAIILAGGTGTRVGANVPKQFIEIQGRPVLAYTIERFEKHPDVDAIEIVCVKSYHDYLNELIEREGFTKVRWVADGGSTFQESVINGIHNLEGDVEDDDIILIHYGASPFTDDKIIADAIRVCEEKGNASPAHASVLLTGNRTDDEKCTEFLDRDNVMIFNTPQALKYGYACWLYEEAETRGLLDKIDPHTVPIMLAMGEPVYFSYDSTTNIKITTKDDVLLFEGYVLAQKAHANDADES